MIVHTPLGEAGASPSQRPDNRPDGAQKMIAWIKKWNEAAWIATSRSPSNDEGDVLCAFVCFYIGKKAFENDIRGFP
jgi:hypothetical protein